MRGRIVAMPGDMTAGIANIGECAACGSSELIARHVIDGIDMALCLDAVGCAGRYRAGASPESYGAGLRGEILAVAP